MKRILLTMVMALLVSAGLFAATEPTWYNDVTSITANGQYYIYSVNGKGFMEANNANVITASLTKTPSLFTVTSNNDGYAYSGGKYVVAYQTHDCGPIGGSTDDGAKLIWTLMNSGAYWNIHGHYTAWLSARWAALYYDNNKYEATANLGIASGPATQTGTQYQWYLISQDQYSRHWLIYQFDLLKESINISDYSTTVHQDLYTALATAMTPTFNVKTDAKATVQTALTALQTAKAAADAYPALYAAAESAFNTARSTAQTYLQSEVPDAVYTLLHAYDAFTPNVVTTALTDIQAATTNLNDAIAKAEDTKTVYTTCLNKITALENVTDKGDGDIALITTDIANAHTAIEQATTSAAVNTAVDGLRQIDNVTALTTAFNALETLTGVAQAASGLDLTYTSEDLTTVNGALLAIKSGSCVIQAATAGNATYYPFMRRVTVTIAKIDPTVSLTAADITYPATVHSSTLTNTGTEGQATWLEADETRMPGTYTGLAVHFKPTDTGVYNEVNSTVTLTVLPPTTYGDVYGGACTGATYYYNGNFYEPGTHTLTLRNRLGGDSIVTLHVEEYPTYDQTFDVQIYGNETFLWNCQTYTTTGNYSHTYMTRHGCDSTVTIRLTVLTPTTYGAVSGQVCPGQTYYYNGQFYAAGSHTVTMKNHYGGDSIVTLTVTEYPTYNQTFDVQIYGNETFLWNCDTYTESGTFSQTYMSQNGCDSTVTIRLTVLRPTTYGAVIGQVCPGQTYEYNGQPYAVGAHTVTMTNRYGGDSIVTLTVSEYPTYNQVISASLCQGETYNWGDETYTTTGTYTHTFASQYGCDSTVTLNLQFRPVPVLYDEPRSIAVGWQETWRGRDLSNYTSGFYTLYDTLPGSTGCDSIRAMELTVFAIGPTTYGTDSAYTCPDETYNYHSHELTDSGTYVITIRNMQYGDSVVTFHLRYWPTYKKKSNRVIHQGINYKWRGQQLSGYDVGSYILWDSLQTMHGCDSLFYCTLTILPPETQYNEVYAAICPGDTFYFETQQFTDSGIYELPVAEQSRFRGDSINRIHLAWNPNYLIDKRRIMYEGQSVRWHGTDLSVFPVCDTLIYDSLHTRMGCDSVFRLHLTVLEVPTTYLFDTIHICDGEPFVYCRDTVISTAGDYVFRLTNFLGGDSIVSLHVEDHHHYYFEDKDTVLQGDVYYWRGREYTFRPYDHVLTDSLLSIYGCDSVYRLFLHVIPREYKIVEEMSVCQNSSHTWRGMVVPTDSVGYFSEVLTDPFFSGFDEDSVYVLNLTVNASPVVHYTLTWKQGHQKTWYLEHFSTLAPGYYTFTSGRFLHTHQGCDSLEVMHLQVLPTTYGSLEVNLCPGEEYIYEGKTYTKSGVYTVVIDNHYFGTDSLGFNPQVHGDSIVTLVINTRPNYDLHPEMHASYGDTLWWRGVPHHLEVGTFVFRDTAKSVYECDSLTTLTVYVDRALQSITWNPDTLSVHAADSILLRATASSGLTVSFATSSLFYAYVNERNWLVGRNVGQVSVTAVQNGNHNYYAAPPVQYIFDVLEPLPYDALETVRPDDSDALPDGSAPQKFIHNGHLYIRTSHGLFTASGELVE